MAEASRSRVTITLGSDRKVVKRTGAAPEVEFFDSRPVSGSKRSVRDRLGISVDRDGPLLDGSQVNSKRQRGDGYGANQVDDYYCIGKDDLRLKLMQKNGFRGTQTDNLKGIDLREKLSRTGRPSLDYDEAEQRRPESRDIREQIRPELRDIGILQQFSSTRGVTGFPRVEPSRSSYSPWNLEQIRRRSPEKVIHASRGLSPPRNVEELPRRPINRTYDDVRAVPYVSKDVLGAPRSMGSSLPVLAKSATPMASAKPAPPAPPLRNQILPPSSIVAKPMHPVQEQQNVDGFLQSIGLGKYAIIFKAEEVDMTALKQMRENDLKELGIPMGPRKKIILALLPRNKRQQP